MTQESSNTPDTAPTPQEPTIQLDHFLQSCGVATGGQAKRLIQAGEVMVNGAVEKRRKMKLRVGDEVAFDGDEFEVALGGSEESD